jgi:Protein of unknown function (DUF4230)
MSGLTIRGLVSAFTASTLLFVPFGLWSFGIQPPGGAKPPDPPPPSLAIIQSVSELATTRLHLSDFIEGQNNHYKGKWILHGEVILGVDLSKAVYVEAHPADKTAVLHLPPPHLISSRVDHDRSEEMYIKAVAWVPLSSPKLLRDAVWQQADRKIQKLGQEPKHRDHAKQQAEKTLRNLFEGLGWKVRFEWTADTPSTIARAKKSSQTGGAR